MVLKYIYTGELELKKYPGEIILGLLVASDELLLGELFEHVQDYLIVLFLLSEIEEYYFKGTLPMTTTLPPRSGIIQKIESNIIKPRLSSIIINWIERKDSYYNRKKKDKAYNLNLIYRKSRDVTTNMKISRVINSSYAICNTGNGVNFGGTDLNLENDYLSLSYSGNYENLDINLERNRNESLMDMDYLYGNLYDGINRHEVEEIEFFRVMKIK
ncbi:unnamed protein product [Rhizophagus irregularis]|nr:unnamed protein product [Rhizophagus irregularis]